MKHIHKLLILFFLAFSFSKLTAHEGAKNNYIHKINTNYSLYQACKDDIEGYTRMLKGSELSYPSLREDHRDAMIARTTTGKMGFEFMTGIVPENITVEKITFFFYSDIDLNLKYPFDLSINDQLLLTFAAQADGSLNILNNPGKGDIEFILVERDLNGDGIGALRLTVPASMVKKGVPSKISIYGHKKSSNSWFMIFKVPDAIKRLKESASLEVSFQVRQFNDLLLIDAPAHLAGETVYLVSDGKKSKKALFNLQGSIAKVSVKATAPTQSFQLHFKEDIFELKIESPNKEVTNSEVVGKFIYYMHAHGGNGWSGTFTKYYRPDYFQAFSNFFDRKYEKGHISIMNSSHQDIAWVERPEICIILRDTLLLTPILNDAFQRDDYGFDVEDGLMLREYIERHPDSKEKLNELLKQKRLSIGATYNCPYEDMYSGEDLVRQLYVGKKWLKETFEGYDSKVYWNVDVPGKTLQMPQILRKAGVGYMVISRHAKGMFHWASPDGSSVFTYSPGHYGEDLIHLSKDIGNKMKYSAEQVVWWNKFYDSSEIYTPLLSSQDMLPAIDYSGFIEAWNNTSSVKDEEKKDRTVYFPNMELMTVEEFLPLAEEKANLVDTIVGERPNVWVYIHGPTHHDALTASREGSKLLTAAEKFSTIAYLLDADKMKYPTKAFDEAWQEKVYPDHGWGGHDGDITDALFKEKFVSARTKGEKLLERATQFISQRIDFEEEKGMPVILYNSLSWMRTDPVSVHISLDEGKTKSLYIKSYKEEKIDTQLSNITRYEDGSIKEATITFIAADIPSLGYKTYYIEFGEETAERPNATVSVNSYENDHYQLTFKEGGLSQVYDKSLKKNLFTTDRFKVGEVFTLQSEGNGAGEFGDIQQPSMENFDQVSNYKPEIKIIENGAVFTKYRIKQQILHAIVEQDITIYHFLKRIQFDNRLLNWDGKLYREFRTAYPIALEKAEIAYDVPFGAVRVGKDEIHAAGERYTPLCKDVHPRAIMDWIGASNREANVTISSSVAAADWIDPTGTHKNAMLQHLLLASRKSCHWEGNVYSQEGNHAFSHIMTSHANGENTGQLIAEQFNEPIIAVVNPDKSTKANLKGQNSFFSFNEPDVRLTALKKAENSNSIIARMYNVGQQEKTINMNSFFPLEKFYKTNIIEETPSEVKELTVPKYAIETFELEVKPSNRK